MKLTFSAPSKTFLLGEYSVLRGGPCLLLASEPRFKMKIEVPGEGMVEGVHMSSPAGRWVRLNNVDFQGVHGQFIDPHLGRGGFGASSAEFLFAYLWSQFQHGSQSTLLERVDPFELRAAFLSLFEEAVQKPSGADLIGQWMGGLCEFRPLTSKAKHHQWKFNELDVALVRTGEKVPTHQHLEQVAEKDLSQLVRVTEATLQELSAANEDAFLEGIIEFQNCLSERGLTLLSTQQLLAKLMGLSPVRAVKGCGALGADVVAVFYEKDQKRAMLEVLSQWGLQVVMSELSHVAGVQISIDAPTVQSVVEKSWV